MRKVLQLLLPGLFVTVYAMFKYRALISPRAEVDINRNLSIGRGSVVSAFAKIKANGPLTIGRNVSIGSGCFISADAGGVEIGDYCMIGANSCVIGNNYSYRSLDVPICNQEKTSKGISIGRDVWLGANVSVVDGAIVEEGSIVAPNSLISRRVERNQVVQGNPHQVLFTRR